MNYEPGCAALVGSSIFPFRDIWPVLGPGVWLAPGSRVIGDVTLGDEVSIWYNTVVRGDVNRIIIGSCTNIQDNSCLHVTRETNPLTIGERVTIGHSVVLHGCTIGNEVLIGIHATVLDGAVVESGAMVGAGAVVSPGMVIPSGWLALGVPAKLVRPLRPAEIAELSAGPLRYRTYAAANRDAVAAARASAGK